MAKAPTAADAPADEDAAIVQFKQLTLDLIDEAARYGAAGVSDPKAEGNIATIRIMTTALQGALQGLALSPRPTLPSS